jgi:hypothetical protein
MHPQIKWLWLIVGVIAVAGWLYFTAVFLTAFSVSASSVWHTTHPASFFERRDAATCPGYGERDDEELSACIHQAYLSQRDWMSTRIAASQIARMGEMLLIPPLAPIVIWALVYAIRRTHRRRAT